jgi:hypothetical protein
MMGATTSRAETSFTFLLVSTQPLAKGWSRDSEAVTYCARISKYEIRLDPIAPLALRTIFAVNQLSKSFTVSDDVAVGLWATCSVVHQVHSLPHQVKRCL